MPGTILIIDDDELLRRSLAFNLERSRFSTRTASSAEDGIEMARQSPPDLVLLDIGLPGMDGLAALRRLRDEMRLPVILLTARRRELDEVLGLELGADDYVTKPFDFDVLLAHIKAVLRRAQGAEKGGDEESSTLLRGPGNLLMDVERRSVVVGEMPVELTKLEFDLFHLPVNIVGYLNLVSSRLGSDGNSNHGYAIVPAHY